MRLRGRVSTPVLHFTTLMNLIYFLLLIGPLVFAHELGHFLMAKAFGIKVEKFSLGFGPVLLGRQIGETFYQIAAIPLGGFVRFLGEDPRDVESATNEDLKRSWHATARWKRALVVFAGPAMSLILPVFCYFFVGLLRDELRAPAIGQVIPGTPAERAGLQPGDMIREIDGEKIYGFEDLQRIIATRPDQELRVGVQRNDETVTVKLRPALVKRMRFRALDITEEVGQIGIHNVYPAPVIGIPDRASPAAKSGLQNFDIITKINNRTTERWIDAAAALEARSPGQSLEISYLRQESVGWTFADIYVQQPRHVTLEPQEDVELGNGTGIELASLYLVHVVEGMPAAKAGIRAQDKIVAVDEQPIQIWAQLFDRLSLAPEKVHHITVLREGQEHTYEIQPEQYESNDRYTGQQTLYREPGFGVYQVGVSDDPVPNENRISRAMLDAFRGTFDVIKFMGVGFLRILQGRISLQSIGGPIMLWEIAGTAGRQGASSFLSIIALISVNLGLLNLFPIPILDGGHLVILGVESIRRRSLSNRAREIINIVGLVLLLLLMVYAFKNDIQRYWDWEDVTRLFQ